jgi:hypothetical protein
MPTNANLLAIDVQKPDLGFDREAESGFEGNRGFGSIQDALAGEHVGVDLGPSLEELIGWGSVGAWIVGSGEGSWHRAPGLARSRKLVASCGCDRREESDAAGCVKRLAHPVKLYLFS